MKQFNVEYTVGLFMLAGLLCLFWLVMDLGGVISPGNDSYTLSARFVSASGLKPGADVELAGVVVGQVTSISFQSLFTTISDAPMSELFRCASEFPSMCR